MGIAFNDFVLLAADRTCSAHGILVVKPGNIVLFYFFLLLSSKCYYSCIFFNPAMQLHAIAM